MITSGLGQGEGSLSKSMEHVARAHSIRLLGPNCLGLQVPGVKLNASFAAHMSKPGDLALIWQSGAIAAGLIEWAAGRSLGFSAVVSPGDKVDVDFAELDYFALDRGTRAILLYIEAINDARKFMSAARAAARIKPVVVIKFGRHQRVQWRPEPIPAPLRAPTRSMTPLSGAPVCSVYSIWTNFSMPRRRLGGCGPSRANGSLS